MKPNIYVCLIVVNVLAVAVLAGGRNSEAFQFKYEANALPSDVNTTPRWERVISGGTVNEAFYNSVLDGLLTIDNVKSPSPTEWSFYYIPGQYSDFMDGSEEFYTWEDPCNLWNPDKNKGYTVEISFRMISTQDPQDPAWPEPRFAFWLQLREGQSSGGYNNHWQFFTDRIKTLGNTTIFTGDLTDKLHKFRVVRYPNNGGIDLFDLYLDGELLIGGTAGIEGSYSQDDISFGDEAGGQGGMDIKVEIDYVRFDLSGAYTYPYLVSDVNRDKATNFEDFALMASAWLMTTDQDGENYVNCLDPNNSILCQ